MTTRPPFSGYTLPGSGIGGGALASIAQFSFPAVVGPPAVPAIPSVIAGVYRLA